MNYWKILESMNGLPTENMWNALWGSGGGSGEIEYVGAVPFSVIAKGGNASEWSLYGAGPFQEWTPSPEKERSANLFCPPSLYGISIQTGEVDTNTGRNHGDDFVEVRPNVTYRIKFDVIATSPTDCNFWIVGYDENKQMITDGTYNASYKGSLFNNTISKNPTNHPFVTSPTTKYIRWYTTSIPTNWDEMRPMLNEGSTALPYEPYGYRDKTGPCEVKGVGDRTRNLLDTKIQWKKRFNGSEVTNTDTGFILIKKTESAQERVFVSFKNTKTGQYTVSLMLKNDKDRIYDTYGISVSDEEQTTPPPTPTGKTAIVNAGQYINIIISTQSAKAGTLEVSNIMLNEGSEPLPYEPYGYKTTVVDSGKNLIDKNRLLKGYFYRNTTNIVFYSSESSLHRYIGININKINNYTISLTPKENGFIRMYETDDSGKITDIITDQKDITIGENVVISRTKKPLTTTIYIQSTVINWDNLQLEEGTTATPYVPYREPIETVIYSDEPYFTNDYIRKDSTGGVEHREWGKLVFTGNENLYTYGTGTSRRILTNMLDNLAKYDSESYTSHFQCTKKPNKGIIIGGGSGRTEFWLAEYLGEEIGSDATKLRQYFKSEYDAGHPVVLYYKLLTPTDTPKDLPEILLVNGYNGFDVDTEIKPEKMTLTYRVGKETAEADARLTAEFLNMMEEM